MEKFKVILDTDIGDDIDDAFALALMHSHPGFELIGVTTVYRDTKARAQMVAKYFDAVGEKHIPIRAGESLPIKEPLKTLPNELDTLGKPCSWDESYQEYPVNKESAVDFIISQAHRFAREMVLVPIGALTNIARAIQKDPTIVKKIKKIVMMGGWFTNHAPEWNIIVDPEAADIVFRSGIPIDAIGLDVTLKCTFESDLLDELFTRTDSRTQLLAFWFKKWQESTKCSKSVMHDPLAVATIVAPVCEFSARRVRVNLTSLRGATDVLDVDDSDGNIISTADTINRDMFYTLLRKELFN
ncbi:MAG TPA: hypothetical protein DCM23_01440 [Firmicutes bacterium]|nr:hypothetical protein [Bacillota bacterium]